MQIQNIKSSNTFTSRNNPIPTEAFISSLGKITMGEASAEDITPVAKLIRQSEMRSFKLRNFYGSNAAEAKEFYKQINKNSWLKDIKAYLNKVLSKPDGNSSLLVAKNEEGKVVGYATMENLDGVDPKIGVIENIYLDFYHTNSNLGHYLLYKIAQTAKGQFSDIVTQSPYIGGHHIYSEFGFSQLPSSSKAVRILNTKYNCGEDYDGWLRKNLNYYI